ncbi:hypothetical protein P4S72_01795 [Vibrio sp. PP-XX7]
MGIDASLAHLNASGGSSSCKENQHSRAEDRSENAQEPAISGAEHASGSSSDWCNHVFGSFLSIYETQWEYQYGSLPTGRFIEFAESIDVNGLNRVLKHCHERIQLGNSSPPQMGEMWVLRDALTAEEPSIAGSVVLSRTPGNQIEKWLVQNKLYALKLLAESKVDAQFKKYYLEARRLDEKGLLRTELPTSRLPDKSVKNLNDLKREEYEQLHGKQLNPRIQRIIDNKG